MNVAGPSRVVPSARLALRARVESTYEEDLMELLGRLTLDDIDEMQSFYARPGARLTDNDIAMNDLLQQARALALLNQDMALAQGIADGELAGRDQDRELAQHVADVVDVDERPVQRPVPVPRQNGNGTATQRNGAEQAVRNDAVPFRRKWKRWISSVVDSVFGSKPASQLAPANTNTTTPPAPVVNRPTGHTCVICQDPIFGAEIRAPCGHYYGIDCVTDLFQSATRDETLFPPRCCRQNIPLAQVQPHLSQALVTTFQQKQVEFTTLKRVYCSAPTCSHFLGPLSEGAYASKVYTCPAPGCTRRTCGKCREQHSSDWMHACRPDADATQVLELGRTAGWARCPGCSQMIELNIGCFHMTCRCRTEFCYLCRARWKTCPCPQWDERRLLAAAEARVDAQLGVGRERGARRDVPAQRAIPVPVPANRTQAPGARVPPPLPARRPASASFVAPSRPPAVDARPTPARTPAASTSTRRPTNTAPAPAREAANHNVRNWTSSVPEWRITAAATHTNASTSPSASTSTSAFASASRSKSASTPGPSYARPKSMHAGNADPMRQRMVQEMMAQLQEDHECDHTRWRYRHGGGICQTCQHNLPLFLFRCQGCELLVCKRCRFNRF